MSLSAAVEHLPFVLGTPPGLALVALTGLFAGSFIGVVADRLPRMQALAEDRRLGRLPAGTPAFNLAVPRSHCPACKSTVRWYDNLPVISWLLLRGRCRDCGQAIPATYPAVELAGMAAVLGPVLAQGATREAAFSAVLLLLLLAAVLVTLAGARLPRLAVLGVGLLAGLGASLHAIPVPAAIDAGLGALMGFGSGLVASLVLRPDNEPFRDQAERFGLDDALLLAAAGAWVGWAQFPELLLVTFVAMAFIGTSRALLRHTLGPLVPGLAVTLAAFHFCGPFFVRALGLP